MKKISAVIVLILIAGGFLAFWLLPDRASSEMENRTLAQRPQITLSGYLDESFRTRLEDYIADQFPLRDMLLKCYKKLTTRRGRMPGAQFREVVEGADGYNYYVFDENQILNVYASAKPMDQADACAQKFTEISALCEKHGVDLFLDLVPSKTESLSALLPAGTEKTKDIELQKRVLERLPEAVTVVRTMEAFEKIPLAEKAEMYYHTDHHWNNRGADRGFEVLCNALAAKGFSADYKQFDYRETVLEQTEFAGSYNRNLGYLYSKEERLAVTDPADPARHAALTFETHNGAEPVYRTAVSGSYVSYATIYTDDLGYYHVHNENALNDYTLCVLKDSFYNALAAELPLLFRDVYVVDPRHEEGFVLEDFLTEKNADGLLLFYCSTALMKDDIPNYQLTK